MEIKHQFVEARGVRHHVAEVGAGFPIVFLHGWPEFWACWEPVFERLHSKYKLIAIDFRGFGESDNPNPKPSDIVNARCLAEDIIALLDEMGLERVGFVGHDVSASVIQEIARLRPELGQGLFFFNCSTPGIGSRWNAPNQINEIWYQTFHQMPYAADMVGQSNETCQAHIKFFLDHWSYKKGVFDSVLDRWTENFMRPGNLQGGFNWYRGQNSARIASMTGDFPTLPKIDIPTRVLWGRHDPIIKSEWSDCLGDTFTNFELSFAEEAGHFVHYEMPDLAASEISCFF